MQENTVLLDCNSNLDDADTDATLQSVLSSGLLEQTVKHTLQAVNISQTVTLSLLITDDTEMQALNSQYRQQDKPTDVLSFPLLDEPLVDAPVNQLWQAESEFGEEPLEKDARPAFITPSNMPTNLGDIVISWPTVRRQAEQAGHQAVYELLYLLSHGTLHLVGYDDQTEEGYQAMVRLQESVMQEIDWDALSQ
ncbi:MAG TPA: rRNA maturation RNase YbeY [Ktedonobacteraceae bacterium]|nr:rRNA maturation RNase YbeY [Ktedonobacteraceae bacterium]